MWPWLPFQGARLHGAKLWFWEDRKKTQQRKFWPPKINIPKHCFQISFYLTCCSLKLNTSNSFLKATVANTLISPLSASTQGEAGPEGLRKAFQHINKQRLFLHFIRDTVSYSSGIWGHGSRHSSPPPDNALIQMPHLRVASSWKSNGSSHYWQRLRIEEADALSLAWAKISLGLIS